MRSLLLPLVALAFVLPACGGAGADDGADPATEQDLSGSWQKVLECDGATVDVDPNDRAEMQVVIRGASNLTWFDANAKYGQTKNAKERIYRGRSPWGVFAPGDFKHLRKFEVVRNAAGETPGLDVIRDGDDLDFRVLDLAKKGCQPFSSGRDDVYPAECEKIDFVFHGCK